MKIATFNVNSVRARLDIVLDWLKRESPEVLCIQETKVEDGSFPELAFKEIRYHAVYRGEKAYNGVAILAKKAPDKVTIGFDDNEIGGSRLISASFGKVTVVNTYTPQGYAPGSQQFRSKLDWFQMLYDYFDSRFSSGDPVVWCGDFNVAPEPRDVYDPETLQGQIGYHPDEHAALGRFRQWGFEDVFRIHNDEAKQYSFWDYRVFKALERGLGWRIDHIWATKTMAARSVGAWIDRAPRMLDKPSDHTPVVAEFK